ncbi:MAG: hypothetical protein R2722_16050 [Tessaracoccus sp.]
MTAIQVDAGLGEAEVVQTGQPSDRDEQEVCGDLFLAQSSPGR